ncbi:hypothetical protein [Chitinophaga qingshengii]|uniref:Uncharacterized protein n=1 Tax=Chitinophaga qingshengii TaxID=1569794 RepID=A0ABR7TK01_9BACT|nr:hypothetical protein [Chitinophaga qingshengii]MBC9929744.1 hypothetical protein [Chitinophaga qingshengii]
MKMSQYLRQGKSENYQDAEEKGLLKAGEVAKWLSKKFNEKITAAELTPFATEWHHAGVFKAGAALKGKRVYFFAPAAVEKITLAQILAGRQTPAKDMRPVKGWFPQYFRMTDPVSRRTYHKRFVGIYEGPAHKAPKGFQSLPEEVFTRALQQKGKELKAGETPVF